MPGEVPPIVRVIPLWRLQTVGDERLDILYENTSAGSVIELRPGVASCFRKFHTPISGLVRGAWSRYVRQQNFSIIGEVTDHHEILFGSERADLAVVRPVLMDIQASWCFYWRSALTASNTHVDHFVPWSRYPIDLGHNFVLADNRSGMIKRIQDQLSVGTWNKGCSAYRDNGPRLRRKP